MDGCRTTKKIKNQRAHKQHPQATEGALGAEALSHGAYSERFATVLLSVGK